MTEVKTLTLTTEEIVEVAEIVLRIHGLLERVRENNRRTCPHGQEVAPEIVDKVDADCGRIAQFFEHLHGEDREKFALAMGWDTADRLLSFVQDGARPKSEVAH